VTRRNREVWSYDDGWRVEVTGLTLDEAESVSRRIDDDGNGYASEIRVLAGWVAWGPSDGFGTLRGTESEADSDVDQHVTALRARNEYSDRRTVRVYNDGAVLDVDFRPVIHGNIPLRARVNVTVSTNPLGYTLN
jgi:hypothetical protein